MSIEIRAIQGDGEARELRRIGRRSFHPVFTLIIPRPKWAFGAFEDGRCLGGVLLKTIGSVGVVDFIFVAKEGRGRGLAKQLVQTAMDEFKSRGVTHVAASVRDDNTASWNLFAARGMKACSFSRLVGTLGLGPALSLSFATGHAFAFGFDLWVGTYADACDPSSVDRVTPADTAAGNGGATVTWHLFVNLLPASAGVWRYGDAFLEWLLALGILVAARLLFGFVGTIPFFRPVRLRMARGGYVLALPMQAVGSVFFYPAYWHPRVARWREPDYRNGLGVSALMGVLATLGLVAGSSVLLSAGHIQSEFVAGVVAAILGVGRFVLIIEVQPLFEAWSGPRIIRWNLAVYLIVLAAAVAVLVWA